MLIKPFWISPPASAKDDAAGQAIANRMTAQITGLAQAQRNANDGISIAQTAEGSLNQVNDNLQRIRELSVQAANGTNSEDDLQSIQEEITQRLAEIDRISEETAFNGVNVLSSGESLAIQVGANDNEVISIQLKTINSATLGLENFDVTKSQAAVPELGKQVGFNETLGAIYELEDHTDTFVAIGSDGELVAVKTADTATAANGGYEAMVSNGGNATYVYAANDADENDFSKGTLTLVEKVGDEFYTTNDGNTTVIDPDNVDALVTAKGSLGMLDQALKTVDTLRSDLGAIQNRFEDAITNLNTNETNLAAARSRIEDADYAVEVANMTRAQILQQAGTSVLAQANQIPQNVLSLLG